MLDRKALPMEDEADQRWRIGDGPDDVKLEDLVLVSIHHVSLGSWQPQLRLVRPRPQRFGAANQQRQVQAQAQAQGQAQAAAAVMAVAAAASSVMPPNRLPPTPMSATHALPRQPQQHPRPQQPVQPSQVQAPTPTMSSLSYTQLIQQ
jgi:hypothetical protein